jgi:hypothetical protein
LPHATAPPPRLLVLSTEPGTGTGAYRLLEYFLEAARPWRGQLLIVAPEDSDVYRTARRCEFPLLAWPAPRDTFGRHVVAALTLRVPPGIGVVHAWHTRGFEPALLLGRRLGARVAASLHDHPVDSAHSAARLRLLRVSARRMDALVSVGETLARVWTPFAGRVPLRVIRNGIPDVPPPERAAASRVRVGYAGLYSPATKGWTFVREWMRRSFREDWPVEWRLFGLTGRNPALEREVREVVGGAPAGSVQVSGFTPTEAIFRDIDLLVHPSNTFDPYPTLLLEAARAGLPVFCSDAGGSPEIVRDGETGRVFSLADAGDTAARLRQMIADEAGRARMGAAARSCFETRHAAPAMVSAYLSFWSGLQAAEGARAD